jgi:hypothetical protein
LKEAILIMQATDYDSKFSFADDDEPVVQDNDEGHQEKDRDVQLGKKIAREKKYHAARVGTVSAAPLDGDVLPEADSQEEQIELRRGKIAEDDEEHEPELLRAITPKTAKQQVKDKLAVASKGFDFSLLKEKKTPANDNFKPVVSWPLMDQLTRKTFEPDKERRAKNVISVRYLRELIDLDEADSLGMSVHLPGKDSSTYYDLQRTESGKVWFEQGQTLDRKKVTYDTKNDEENAERYSGPVRTAKHSVLVSNSGFDVGRDDPFPVRVMKAREELDAIKAAVGPVLWPSLKAAVSDNATLTDIGLALGAKRFQASREGTRVIRLALTAAIDALGRLNNVKDEPRRTAPLPDKSRGSFYNQTRGLYSGSNHVVRVAA